MLKRRLHLCIIKKNTSHVQIIFLYTTKTTIGPNNRTLSFGDLLVTDQKKEKTLISTSLLTVFKSQCERQQEQRVMCVSCWALQAHIHHTAKVQRLMTISHPALASIAVTLSCWLNLALLTTKLPLSWPSHNIHRTVSLHSEEPGLNKAEECTGRQVWVGEGSRPSPLTVLPHTHTHTHHQAILTLHSTHTTWRNEPCQRPGNCVRWCWRSQGSLWQWESSTPLSVFTVFKVGARSTCLSGGWLNEWHNKKWNN